MQIKAPFTHKPIPFFAVGNAEDNDGTVPLDVRTKSILEKFREVHGDRYDYSKLGYKSYKQTVKIICKIHGPFDQMPQTHLTGPGCPECKKLINYPLRACDIPLALSRVIQDFKDTHGDRYDYSLVNDDDYIDGTSRVTILCKEHGPFDQQAYTHKGGGGCPECGRKNGKGVRRKGMHKEQRLNNMLNSFLTGKRPNAKIT